MGSKIDMDVAIAMRRRGRTYQEIGDHFGVTWQAVQEKLRHVVRARKGGDYIEKIPYKGLYDFLMEHDKVSLRYLSSVIYKSPTHTEEEVAKRFCMGRNASVPKKGIDRLLAYTGMTYEKLFELREGFEEEV